MSPRRAMGPRRIQSTHHVVLGNAIRELRVRRDLSQETLGFQADLHRNYVGAIERGEINPTFKVLMRVSTGLGFPLSEVFALYELRLEKGPRG